MKLSPPFPFRKKGAFSIGVVVVLIWLFLFTQAELIYGQWAIQVREIFTLYIVMFLIFASAYRKGMPGRNEGLKSMIPFGIMAVLTLVIAIPFSWVVTSASMEFVTIALGFGLLHSFVKAYIEELVFRYYLPLVVGLGDVLSSILFGLFHLSVTYMTGNPAPVQTILLLMGLGYFWSLVRRLFQSQGIGAGIAASTGSHFAWNLVALGLIVI